MKKAKATALLLGAASVLCGCATAPQAQAPEASAAAAPAAAALAISRRAPYAADALVPAPVRRECDLERKVPQILKSRLGDDATLSDEVPKASGRSLELAITQVIARVGGGFTGPKSITVRGTLYDKGTRVGGFTARNADPYGIGVCVQLARAVDEMAGDIATWLQSPGKDDRLGLAKER